jgi:hypothetical protein
MLKKMLAIRTTLDWEYLPFLISKVMNNSVSPKTGFKPSSMVFGTDNPGFAFLDTDKLAPPHFMVKNNQQHIDKLTAELNNMTRQATEQLLEIKATTNDKINKSRVTKSFKKYDYVFVLDRTQIPGASRPLKTRYHPSPYIVIKPFYVTTLVKRLSDGFTSLYSNDDIKKYEATSPLFSTIPPEVSKVLLHDFENLLDSDLCTITKYDKFDLPGGIDLLEDSDTPPNSKGNSNDLFSEDMTVPEPVSEILPELSLSDKLTNIQASIQQKAHIPIEPDTVMEILKQSTSRLNDTLADTNTIQLDKTVPVKLDSMKTAVSDSGESDKEESDSEQDPPQSAPNMEPDEQLSLKLKVTDNILPSNSATPQIPTLRKTPPPSQMVLRPRKNHTVTFQE